MKTPEEIFDEWTLSSPYILHRFYPIPLEMADPFAKQKSRFDERIRQIREQFIPGRNIDIYCDYIDDGTCNAIADIYQPLQVGIVALHKGLILLPIDTFYKMLSHPLCLYELDNGGHESSLAQHNEGIQKDWDDLIRLRKHNKRSNYALTPLSIMRKRIAEFCAELCWDFITIHEIIHIVHGHVEYCYTNIGAIPFVSNAKYAASNATSLSSKDTQTIEWWADDKATAVIFGGLLKTKKDPDINEFFPTLEQRIFIWSFAMYTFFRIWGLEVNQYELLTRSHLPQTVRYALMLFCAKSLIIKWGTVSAETFDEQVRKGQISAENAIRCIGGPSISPSEIVGWNDPVIRDRLKILNEHFEDVVFPKIMDRKFAYVPLTENEMPDVVPTSS
ncbi:MAG TPA: hypothetical protein VGG19_10870 [Tepidisphaeraceae bacterium]|jgi:hypothetical protein